MVKERMEIFKHVLKKILSKQYPIVEDVDVLFNCVEFDIVDKSKWTYYDVVVYFNEKDSSPKKIPSFFRDIDTILKSEIRYKIISIFGTCSEKDEWINCTKFINQY